MTELEKGAELTALWRRWRTAHREGTRPAAPDPLRLAAYAEHRLDEATAADIEAWLAANPEGIQDLMISRREPDRSETAAAEVIERALRLVSDRKAQVIPFERPRRRVSGLRLMLAWGGMAASIAATGFVGFVLGSDAYGSFMGGDLQTQATTDQDLVGPPMPLFADPGEESNI